MDDNDIKNYTVYVHQLPKELSKYDYDKYYVGLTRNNVEKRWGNGNNYSYGKFHEDIKKFGWNNINHIIVAEHLTPSEAGELEQNLIRVLHSVDPDYGYNRTRGGEMSSEESRRKMKINKAQKRQYYKNLPLEDQLMILQSRYKRGDDNPASKKIHQFTIDGKYICTYNSCPAAAKALGVTRSTIYSVAQHYALSCKGYILEYDDNVIQNGEEYILKYNYYHVDPRSKPILVFDLNKNFVTELSGAPEAGRFFNLNKGTISPLILNRRKNGERKRAKGKYYLIYKDDLEGLKEFLTL